MCHYIGVYWVWVHSKILLLESPLHLAAPYWDLLLDSSCTLHILIKPCTVSTQYTTKSSIHLAEEWKNIWWIGVKRKCQVVWCMRNATELFIRPDWVDCQTASQCEDCFLPQAEWWSAFTKSDNLCRPALPQTNPALFHRCSLTQNILHFDRVIIKEQWYSQKT